MTHSELNRIDVQADQDAALHPAWSSTNHPSEVVATPT
jgi:hypothetical protein